MFIAIVSICSNGCFIVLYCREVQHGCAVLPNLNGISHDFHIQHAYLFKVLN